MNQNAAGNINKRFSSYSNDVNSKMLKQAFKESKSEVNIDEHLQQAVANLAENVKCG
jgi:hypothetical protein